MDRFRAGKIITLLLILVLILPIGIPLIMAAMQTQNQLENIKNQAIISTYNLAFNIQPVIPTESETTNLLDITAKADDFRVVKTKVLESGDNLIHGFIYYDGYLWASTRTSPCRILKIDPDTLDYERIILDAGLDDGEDITAAAGYIWVILYTSPSKIIRVDPNTLEWEVAVQFKSDELSYGGSLEYAFGYLWAGGDYGKIARIDLDDVTYQVYDYSAVVGDSQFHALASGGDYLWGSCPLYSWWLGYYADIVVRINPNNPTDYISLYISTPMSDDIAYLGGYLYIGSEESPSYVYKISDSLTYSSAKASDTVCYGIFTHHGYIYGACVGTPGKVIELDSDLNIKATYELPTGFNDANEIAFDTRGNMYVTCWESPAKIVVGVFSQRMIRPVEGKITSPYGWRNNPFTGVQEFHKGIDIDRSADLKPVKTPVNGRVERLGFNDPLAGNWVVIRHESVIKRDGQIKGPIFTKYFHLGEIYVTVGQELNQGDLIGTVGQTGLVTGPHLHFEVWEGDSHVDPCLYVDYPKTGIIVTAHSPVDIILRDPDGLIVSKDSIEIVEIASYLESDLGERIWITDRKIGDYLINVIPHSDASPTDTYTLEVTADNITIVLADGVQVADIPDQPYIIRSTETGIIPITPSPPPQWNPIPLILLSLYPTGIPLYYFALISIVSIAIIAGIALYLKKFRGFSAVPR
nr:M23 family metallopeptidase [Candidatus Freyarchaeota archaeon]